MQHPFTDDPFSVTVEGLMVIVDPFLAIVEGSRVIADPFSVIDKGSRVNDAPFSNHHCPNLPIPNAQSPPDTHKGYRDERSRIRELVQMPKPKYFQWIKTIPPNMPSLW
jgi:hypothetical protein